mgnify:CR=1 FL=1
MIQVALESVLKGQNLSYQVAKETMQEIMEGQVDPVQMGGFLTALALKGESVEEITAFAEVMRSKAGSVDHDFPVVEIVGTGGDGASTFNISTTSGFVIAAAGLPVAKHGGRSVSSQCGAADLIEELGIALELNGQQNAQVLQNCGMCFMFAPVYHNSMKYAAPVRKALGVRTVFNILGPLANPAGATVELMGVYKKELVEPLAQVLANLGVKRGAVVYGYDGLDEITAIGISLICEIDNGQFKTYDLDPADYGFTYAEPQDLVGGDKTVNAVITREILSGAPGAKRTAVLLNAGMALYLGGKADSLEAGIQLAQDMIDSGKALEKMHEFIAASQAVAAQ